MKRNNLVGLLLLTVFLVIISYTSCYQISIDTSEGGLVKDNNVREKRELEDLGDDDFATPTSQGMEEEPGFWDKVVKVALRLFNRFIEWLNS